MNGILGFIVAVLLYPGLIVGLLAAWALGWVRMSARGALSSGEIPHPLAALHEVRGTFERDSLQTEGVHPWAITLASGIAMLFPLVALILLPVPGNPLVSAIGLTGDIVAEGALLLGLPATRLFIGWATPSPYTRLAADRGARQLAGAALAMALAFAASAQQFATLGLNTAPATGRVAPFAIIARILAAIAFAFALPVLARVTALREGEGDLDLVAGELTELSGYELAFFRVGEALQLVAVAALFVAAFVLPIFAMVPAGAGRDVLWLAGAVVTAAGIGAWEGITGYRPTGGDRAPLTWWLGWPVMIALLALVAAAWAMRIA